MMNKYNIIIISSAIVSSIMIILSINEYILSRKRDNTNNLTINLSIITTIISILMLILLMVLYFGFK